MGQGPGRSRQKNYSCPRHYADFIYAIIIEEYGSVLGGSLAGSITLHDAAISRIPYRAANGKFTGGADWLSGLAFSLGGASADQHGRSGQYIARHGIGATHR